MERTPLATPERRGITNRRARAQLMSHRVQVRESAQGKVLNVLFDDGKPRPIATFERGRWEYDFASFARPAR